MLSAAIVVLAIFGPWSWADVLPGSVAGGLYSAAGAIPLPWPDLTRLVDQWPITFAILSGLLVLLIRSRSARRGIGSELSIYWRERLPEPWGDDPLYPPPPPKPRVEQADVSGPAPLLEEVPTPAGAASRLDLGKAAETTAEMPTVIPEADEKPKPTNSASQRT